MGLVPGSSKMQKFMDTQGPYTKWHKTMLTVRLPHLRIPNHRSKTLFSIWDGLNLVMQTPGIWRFNCISIEKKSVRVDPHHSNQCCSTVYTRCKMKRVSPGNLIKFSLQEDRGHRHLNIFRKNKLIGEYKRSHSLITSLTKSLLFSNVEKESKELECVNIFSTI